MLDRQRVLSAVPSLILGTLTMGSIVVSAITYGDDTPGASSPGENDRHRNPAWAACKKQADDQKLERGDARRDFMKGCLKSAKSPAQAPPAQ
jgi:hypothetical protein